QQTLWEVRIPWRMTALGTPQGWTDENLWKWELYSWRRTAGRDVTALARWIAGSREASRLAVDIASDGHLGDHAYLFGRVGEPTALALSLHSRAWLIGVCSGSVLAVGVLALLWKPRGIGLVILLFAFGVAVGAAERPDLVLALLQSSLVGLGLL